MTSESAIFLCGPTASGKSTLALELARALDGEIVNGDAFQLFRGLPILTAAPDESETAAVPHHLYQVLDPADPCDAMAYRRLALPVLEEIAGRGKTPIVVGGSGLYLKFLSHGPSPLPPGDPETRAGLDALELDELVARLTSLDPVEAARTNLANRRYVTRALEIYLLSGRPCSELRDGWASRQRELDARLTGLVIHRRRDDLHHRVDARTARMLEEGAIAEVEALGECSDTFAKAIGIDPIRRFLAGEIDRSTCRERIATATRRYAKRQETWFRREAWLRPVDWSPDAPPPIERTLALLPNRL